MTFTETPPNHPAINIRSSGALAGVIHRLSAVDKPDLQRFINAVTAERGLAKELWFHARNETGYTPSAINYADRNNILLFTYTIIGELEPVNKIAADTFRRRLVQRN